MKKNYTILLVEDEAITAHLLTTQLKEKGYDVRHFFNGEEAVDFTLENRNSINLILMDIELGEGISGTDAACQILEKTDIPIVFLTNHTDPETVEKAENITSYGYIIKKYGIAVIDASIKMALRLFEAKKETEQQKNKLGESEKRLDLAMEVKNEGIWDWDLITNQTYFDDRYYTMAGYEPGEFPHNFDSWVKLVHPDDLPGAKKALDNYFSGESTVYDTEFRFKRKDGTWIWINGKGKIVERDPNKKPLRMIGTHTDITERKNAELLLKENEIKLKKQNDEYLTLNEEYLTTNEELSYANEQLAHSHNLMQYIIEHNRSSVAVHDRDLNYIYVSQRYLEEYKVKGKNIIGKHHYEVFPDLPQKWRDVHQKALKGIVSSKEDDPYCKDDGTVEWTRWECRPWYESNGSIGGFIIYTEVITERKRIEEELKEKNAFIQKILDNLPIGVALNKINEGKVTYINKKFQEIYGWDSKTLKDITTFFEKVYPDKGYREEITKQVFDDINSGDPGKMKWENLEVTQKDGSIRIINAVNIPLFKQNTMVSTVMDVTDQKLAENALRDSEYKHRTLLENAFDGIYLLYKDRFEYVNKQCCNITGYSHRELTDDNFNFRDILTEKSKKILEQKYLERKKDLSLKNVYEFQIKTKTGKTKDVEVSTTSLKGKESPYILGIIRDITNNKKAQELEREILVAKQSAEFKQKFLANMSHELRTPLVGMLGFADMLADTSLEPEQKFYVDTLQQSGENLKEIINLVLDYSKIESGKVTLKQSAFSMKSLFDSVKGLFLSICHKDIELKTTISSVLPKYINTDRQRLFQVLSNLISNAVKFTGEGRITVTAKLAKPASPEKPLTPGKTITILIEVKDTGPGIEKKVQKKLFMPFQQVEDGEIRSIEGTGLGLSICKELSEILGGEIGVDSQPGKGSNFWFTFKAKVAKKPDAEDTKTIKQAKQSKNTPLKVLLVDDKKVNQMVVSIMLKSLGHKVDTADNGREAVEKFKPGKYDIILMDVQMPVMDGIKATKELKKKHKKLPPIVGLSANAMEGDREKYMQKGMDEYLIKPVKKEDFAKVVNKLIAD